MTEHYQGENGKGWYIKEYGDTMKQELNEDINNGIYRDYSSEQSPVQENNENYQRERIRVDSVDREEEARKNLYRRQLKSPDKDFNVFDYREMFDENKYIKNNTRKLTLLESFKEKIIRNKEIIIAGTIAGILAITTIVYGEYQRHSFEEHTQTDDTEKIIPTKEEYEAGMTEDQIIAKREQDKLAEEVINKIMNHEEVSQEELKNVKI